MPELPDVEVFRQYMNSTSLHQKIQNVQVKEPDLLDDIDAGTLQRHLVHQEFNSTTRIGKYLFAGTNAGIWLVLHFGMTGFLKYFKDTEQMPGHVRLLVDFSNGYHLAYDCQRKLGVIGLTESAEEYRIRKELGMDPYADDLDFNTFLELMKNRRGSIKSGLMNQQVIAGIGNVYSDEILFHAGIHPKSKISKLSENDLDRIYNSMQKILQTAIDCKVDPEQFPTEYLLPHRNVSKECPKCSGRLEQAKISGRTSHFCATHQYLKK